jgi:hypothetical protein
VPASVEGFGAASLPAEYTKALGTAGVDALKEFVRAGGSLVLLDNSSVLAIERFGVPVRNPIGKGRIAMVGFRAQNRAQAYGTFRVLFNALYQAGAVSVPGQTSTSADRR